MILTPACRAPWFSHDVETAGRPETCCFDPVVINQQKTQLMYILRSEYCHQKCRFIHFISIAFVQNFSSPDMVGPKHLCP